MQCVLVWNSGHLNFAHAEAGTGCIQKCLFCFVTKEKPVPQYVTQTFYRKCEPECDDLGPLRCGQPPPNRPE